MKKSKRFIFLGLTLLSTVNFFAQVTIGSASAPLPGALLDLKEKESTMADLTTSTKGLILPRVELESPQKLKMGSYEILDTDGEGDEYSKHVGLIVFNTTTITTSAAARLCPGMHVWDGNVWQPLYPYPNIEGQKKVISEKIVSEKSRTPNLDTAKYPIGKLGLTTDTRGNGTEVNTYNYARFYTHNVTYNTEITYEGIKNPLICDASTVKIEQWEETGEKQFIDDGVWMTENMRTKYQTDNASAELMNGHTAVIGAPAYSSPTRRPGFTAVDIRRHGLYYNWAATTNSLGGANGTEHDFQEINKTHGERQGICPTGWHIPSDREFNRLEENYASNGSLFTTTPALIFPWPESSNGETDDGGSGFRPEGEARANGQGKSMKSTIRVPNSLYEPNGNSKLAADGGFDVLLVGYDASHGQSAWAEYAFMWTSSTIHSNRSMGRAFHYAMGNVAKTPYDRNSLMSVRCKKNNEYAGMEFKDK